MGHQIDVYGFTYEDSVPSFVDVSKSLYWHRPTRRYLDKESVDAHVTDSGYTPGDNEFGPDADWSAENLGIEGSSAVAVAATLDPLQIVCSGGPNSEAVTYDIVYQIDESGTDTNLSYAAEADATAADVAGGINTAINTKGDLTGTLTGSTIDLALGTASSVESISVTAQVN